MIQYLFLSTCRFYEFGSKLIRPPGQFAITEWFYSGCQKNVPIFEHFFLQPYTHTCVQAFIPQFRIWVFLNRVLGTRSHASTVTPCHLHRLSHSCDFVFSRLWRKNPSHPLCGWSVTRNFIMESGANDAYENLPTHKHLAMESKDGK
jgi:hypothetical protein